MNMHKKHEMCLKGKAVSLQRNSDNKKKVVGSLSESYGGGYSRGVAKSTETPLTILHTMTGASV